MKSILRLVLFSVLVISVGCKKNLSEQEQFDEDIRLIKAYISDNNLQVEKTASGLYYIVKNQGDGNFPVASDDVTVRYRGYFLDGKTFDQSGEAGITFNLQQVIKGWTEGIPKFREGGDGVLLIPSRLGYGQNGSGSISGGTVLLFDVKLFEIVN